MEKLIHLNVRFIGPLLLQEAISALIAGFPGISNYIEADGTPDVILVFSATLDKLENIHDHINLYPGSKLLMLSTNWTPTGAIQAIQAGVTGCLTTDISPADLASALRQAARGEMVFSPQLQRAIVNEVAQISRSHTASGAFETLSEREQEVLNLLVEGLSNKQIAQHLYLSVRTVENHLRRLYQKLGVNTRTEAAVLALQAGWMQTD